MTSAALYEFTSHVSGKNARVRIFPDRLEWERPRGVSGGKLLAGALTMGASLLATGVHDGKHGTETIPIRAISSISTRRDGFVNSIVSVHSAAGAVDFRVSHAEAQTVRDTLNRLIAQAHA